jgi:hypothetical protein
MAIWEEHCAADTCVSAGDATLQMVIFRLNPKEAVLLAD